MLPRGRCDECGSYETLAQIDDQDIWVCEDCYGAYRNKCGLCENHMHDDDVTVDAHGVTVCPTCIEEEYKQCENCGEYYHADELKTDDYGNEYCETCRDEGEGCWKDELEAEKQDVLYEQRRDASL